MLEPEDRIMPEDRAQLLTEQSPLSESPSSVSLSARFTILSSPDNPHSTYLPTWETHMLC